MAETPYLLQGVCYIIGMKICTKCHNTYPLSGFCKDSRSKDGLNHECRECVNERGRKFRQDHPEKQRIAYLKFQFKITQQDYGSLLDKQSGGCAICGIPPQGKKHLAIDHDHSCCAGRKSCGKCVRGLLCDRCNHGIGNFGDDTLRLEQAAQYIKNFKNTVQ